MKIAGVAPTPSKEAFATLPQVTGWQCRYVHEQGRLAPVRGLVIFSWHTFGRSCAFNARGGGQVDFNIIILILLILILLLILMVIFSLIF